MSEEGNSPSSRKTRWAQYSQRDQRTTRRGWLSKHSHFGLRQLVIWDDAKQKAVITLEFRTSVLGVRLSRSRIVVALLNSVHVFAFSNPPQKLHVFETTDNPMGLACLGQHLIAFPGRSPGQVQLVELETGNVSIIPAHSSPLRAMALSPDGEVLATASEVVWISRPSIPADTLCLSLMALMSRAPWYESSPRGTVPKWRNCGVGLTQP